MSILLVILSIIGAIPDIIKAVEVIWEWIKQIRDRTTRRAMTVKLRQVVLSHLSSDQKQVVDAKACLLDLGALKEDVLAALEKESHAMLKKVARARA